MKFNVRFPTFRHAMDVKIFFNKCVNDYFQAPLKFPHIFGKKQRMNNIEIHVILI